MRQLWQQYLDQLMDTSEIRQLVIYTDHFRYWFANGLLDVAEQLGWDITLQLIEEITDEEGMEIRQGLSFLPSTSLLVVMISDRNPILDELSAIFPLFSSPFGFSGRSIMVQTNLPDQYLPYHLQTDLYDAIELELNLRAQLQGHIVLTDDTQTYLEATITSIASYPYQRQSHVVFPATELVVELDPSTVDGTLVVSGGIGSYLEADELLDPFGQLRTPITLLIEQGAITDIEGNEPIKQRLLQIINLPHRPQLLQLSFGLGQPQLVSGFIDHDRLAREITTISWIDDSNNLLEFVVGKVDILTT